MSTVYLVTVSDYEDATIIGAYSTRELAQAAADATDVIAYGRFGPYVVKIEIDSTAPRRVEGDLRSAD